MTHLFNSTGFSYISFVLFPSRPSRSVTSNAAWKEHPALPLLYYRSHVHFAQRVDISTFTYLLKTVDWICMWNVDNHTALFNASFSGRSGNWSVWNPHMNISSNNSKVSMNQMDTDWWHTWIVVLLAIEHTFWRNWLGQSLQEKWKGGRTAP